MSQHLSRWLPCSYTGGLARSYTGGLARSYTGGLARCCVCLLSLAASGSLAWSAPPVTFDLPQTVAAMPVVCPPVDDDDAYCLVQFELTMSIIVDSLSTTNIDQLVVDIQPLGGQATVVDYAPRTELASQYTSGIEVTRSEEQNRLLTLSLQSQYPGVGSGGLTGTHGDKNTESMKFQRVAPLHLVAASGTTRRGRAVYFKFRSTDQQIIEGERTFCLTLRVPRDWRGEFIEVQVVADNQPSGLSSNVASWAGLTPAPARVGAARFLVTAYRGDCPQSRSVAAQLSTAETRLRQEVSQLLDAAQPPAAAHVSTPASVWQPMTRGLDRNRSRHQELARTATLALHQALGGTLQPHTDRSFRQLPADTRAAFLTYLRAREAFVRQEQTVDLHSSLTAAGT